MSNYGPPGGPRPPQEPYGRQPNDPYGQPNDPYGQPSDPWGGQPASAPGGEPLYGPGYGQPSGPGYGPPSDPRYGDQRPYDQGGYGNDPGYRDQGYGGQRYGPNQGYGATQNYGPPQQPAYDPYQTGWGPASAEPTRRKSRLSPVLILVLTLALLVCGGTGVALYLVGRPDDKDNKASGTPSSSPSASQAASPTPGPASPTPDANSAADARFVKKGQCVKNVGSNEKPQLQITKCANKTYEVLARFDTATTGETDAQAKCKDVQGYTDWYYFDSPLDLNDYVLCLKLR